jgi:hypothetical protein
MILNEARPVRACLNKAPQNTPISGVTNPQKASSPLIQTINKLKIHSKTIEQAILVTQ